MATNSPTRKRYVVAPTTYPWTEFDSFDDAVDCARSRIEKNQRCYAGSRKQLVYAICEVRAYIRPVRPVVDIEMVSAQSKRARSIYDKPRDCWLLEVEEPTDG